MQFGYSQISCFSLHCQFALISLSSCCIINNNEKKKVKDISKDLSVWGRAGGSGCLGVIVDGDQPLSAPQRDNPGDGRKLLATLPASV